MRTPEQYNRMIRKIVIFRQQKYRYTGGRKNAESIHI